MCRHMSHLARAMIHADCMMPCRQSASAVKGPSLRVRTSRPPASAWRTWPKAWMLTGRRVAASGPVLALPYCSDCLLFLQ